MEDERNLDLESLIYPPPPPGFEEKPKKAPGRPRWVSLALIAGACAMLVGLGIWIGTGIGSSKTTQPPESEQLQSPPETTAPSVPNWEANLLRSDAVPFRSENSIGWALDAEVYPVFGSGYRREQIASVTFLDTLAEAPEDAWDVSEAGDGRVMAWVTPADELYDLYIAAEGGVNAANACADLFAGYINAQRVRFGNSFHTTGSTDMSKMFLMCGQLNEMSLDCFDTSAVQDMNYMFYNCDSLTDLDLSSFNTSAVQDMNNMFCDCDSLTDLDLSSFDTSCVQDMSRMFWSCNVLPELDLGSFDTSSVQNMRQMFCWCKALRDLTLGDNFDTSAVQDMSSMFCRCEALTELTLGDSFDTSAVQDMRWMFSDCEALTDLTLCDSFVTTNANTADMFTNCPAGADYQHLLN